MPTRGCRCVTACHTTGQRRGTKGVSASIVKWPIAWWVVGQSTPGLRRAILGDLARETRGRGPEGRVGDPSYL